MNPTPVDPNRLKAMLSGAKRVMEKVEKGDFSTGNVTLDNTAIGDQLVEGQGTQQGGASTQNTSNVAPQMMGNTPVYKNMETSKMPQAIKEAMMQKPIQQVNYNPTSSFTLDDVQDLVDKPIQQTQQRVNPNPAPVNESVQHTNDTFTVSETILRGIIEDIVDKKFNQFMTESYNKKLTENTIKRTITTLINEGKLKTKKVVK